MAAEGEPRQYERVVVADQEFFLAVGGHRGPAIPEDRDGRIMRLAAANRIWDDMEVPRQAGRPPPRFVLHPELNGDLGGRPGVFVQFNPEVRALVQLPPVQRRRRVRGPEMVDVAVGPGPMEPVLEEGQMLIPLAPRNQDQGIQVDPIQMDDDILQGPLVPAAPAPALIADDGEEGVEEARERLARSRRPVPPHWSASSVHGYNCLPNNEFSHLPRFVPNYTTIHTKHTAWSVFKDKVVRMFSNIFCLGQKGKVHDVQIEVDLYYHLMLEMAFNSHTAKSLIMLKTKARRYLAQFDLSYITSSELYRMIVGTCLAAYYTAGLANLMKGFHTNQRVKDIAEYEKLLAGIIS